jgi:manganese transport protein
MGVFAINLKVKSIAWLSASIIIALNLSMIAEQLISWIETSEKNNTVLVLLFIFLASAAVVLLLYILFAPLIQSRSTKGLNSMHAEPEHLKIGKRIHYSKIAVAVDFSNTDKHSLEHAISLGGKNAEYYLVHIVETVGARIMGKEIIDQETETDRLHLENYVKQLSREGYTVIYKLGYGSPKKAIPEMMNAYNPDLLILGAHGHTTWKDMLLGTTIESVRHRVAAPVMVVKQGS